MKALKPAENVFYCGEKDRERTLFDQLIPLPEGTTYNSYFIKGSEKNALIDTVYPPKLELLLDKLKKAKIEKLDYIISNHAEQDHSGALPVLVKEFPDVKIVTNARARDNIKSMLHIEDERFIVIKDEDTLSLGDKTLKFILAPFVHWPDTMFTYIVEDEYLFTCDFLGSHYTTGDIFADYSENLLLAAKRYYAEIMMPFRTFASKYVQKVRELNPKMVLPSHGPIYDKPEFILSAYEDWTSEKVKNQVLIPYVSMYESTKMMAEHLKERLEKAGTEVILWDLIEGDAGELAMAAVDTATVVMGASMVLSGPHPAAVYATYLINVLKPKFKFFAIIGSYGWGGNLTQVLEGLLTCVRPEKLENVIIKGRPTEEDFAKLDVLAEQIIEKHKTI